jgi:PAP2 superfamily protein
MRTALATRTYRGSVEAAAAFALYAVYELVRGFGSEDFAAARLHTADIVALEQHLGLYVERGVQTASLAVPGLGSLLGFLYLALHLVGTGAFLVWVHRRRREAFALVRTTIMLATAIALVGYVLYPAAPPRLAGLGFDDAVSSHTKLNLSSDVLGALYNPIAAVPSLHFGYALIVGVGLAALARRRWVKAIGALYAPAMLYIIVATGNHFLFDALAGGLVVVAAYLAARGLARIAREPLHTPVQLPLAQRSGPLDCIAA